MIREYERALAASPELADAIKILKRNIVRVQSLDFDTDECRTRLEKDDFNDCLNRVQQYLGLTEAAKRNEVFHMGRRREQTLRKNFAEIDMPVEQVETFEALRKKSKLSTSRLANISADRIFQDERFLKFMRDELRQQDLDLDQLPKGAQLQSSHRQKEGIITLLLNVMEKAGYRQEDKNHVATLTGRMHDVSHGIYASRAAYVITADFRFLEKLRATYLFLDLPTQVLDIEGFLDRAF